MIFIISLLTFDNVARKFCTIMNPTDFTFPKFYSREEHDEDDDYEEGEEMLISSEHFLSSFDEPEDERDGDEEQTQNFGRPICRLTENETTKHLVRKFDCFYAEMMDKIKTLKNAPALENYEKKHFLNEIERDEKTLEMQFGTFKALKNTPEVQNQLKTIRQMDDDIKSIIEEYNSARNDRMSVQKEMCEEVARNGDSTLFLELCHFENSQSKLILSDQSPATREHQKPSGTVAKPPTPDSKFIKRNIKLAKEAHQLFALTDEQKVRMKTLLEDVDFVEANDEEDIGESNVFAIPAEDQLKIKNIDKELEKFVEDEKKSEGESMLTDSNMKNDYIMEITLKKIDERLEKLRNWKDEISVNLPRAVVFKKKDEILDKEEEDEGIQEAGVEKEFSENEEVGLEEEDILEIGRKYLEQETDEEEGDIFDENDEILVKDNRVDVSEDDGVLGRQIFVSRGVSLEKELLGGIDEEISSKEEELSSKEKGNSEEEKEIFEK